MMPTLSLSVYGNHNEVVTEWQTFCRWHFEVYFHELKRLSLIGNCGEMYSYGFNWHLNFTEVCSCGFNWQWDITERCQCVFSWQQVSIRNGLMRDRWYTNTRTNYDPVDLCIYVLSSLTVSCYRWQVIFWKNRIQSRTAHILSCSGSHTYQRSCL